MSVAICEQAETVAISDYAKAQGVRTSNVVAVPVLWSIWSRVLGIRCKS